MDREFWCFSRSRQDATREVDDMGLWGLNLQPESQQTAYLKRRINTTKQKAKQTDNTDKENIPLDSTSQRHRDIFFFAELDQVTYLRSLLPRMERTRNQELLTFLGWHQSKHVATRERKLCFITNRVDELWLQQNHLSHFNYVPKAIKSKTPFKQMEEAALAWEHRHAPHNNISLSEGQQLPRWAHKIMMELKNPYCPVALPRPS